MKGVHHIATRASRKLKRLFHTITFKRNVPTGYIRIPSTDSIPLDQRVSHEHSAIDVSSSPKQLITPPSTVLTADQWTDSRPFVDLIQSTVDNPVWSEAPYVRDVPHSSVQSPRRWSYPVHIHSGGAQIQLLTALDRECHQAWHIVSLKKQALQHKATIKEQTEIINGLLESRADFARGCSIARFMKTWQSFAATKKDLEATHMRLAKTENVVAEKQARIEELVDNLEKAEEMAAAKQARTEELVECLDKAIGILETVYERYGSVEPFGVGEDELLRVAFGAVEDGENGDSDGDDMS